MPAPLASDPDVGGLALIVASGDFERVHFALVLAAGAAAIGRRVTLFVTLQALAALRRPDDDGTPGWHRMTTADGRTAAAVDAGHATAGVGRFEELLSACSAMGMRVIVCEMGLRTLGLGRTDLRADVPLEEAGVVSLLALMRPGDPIVCV